MTDSEFNQLLQGFHFKNGFYTNVELVETHISRVILTPQHAIKLKKPLNLGFLNFETLASRKFFCEQELQLNKRMSSIYHEVLPVRQKSPDYCFGGEDGEILDYAIVMDRMDENLRMDHVLERNELEFAFMHTLGQHVAEMHQNADVITKPFNASQAQEDFADIHHQIDWVAEHLGADAKSLIETSTQNSQRFINKHIKVLEERVQCSLQRDVHGDLHTKNIFVQDGKPILFDCIEFNDGFRQIDVLNEVAFLCMDLEARKVPELANAFMESYCANFPAIKTTEDQLIFTYFKAYRANVRAKIGCLQAQNAENTIEVRQEILGYLEMMDGYLNGL